MEQDKRSEKRIHGAIWIVPIVMLLVAVVPLPYAYYMLLRVVVCAAAAFLAYSHYEWMGRRDPFLIVLILIAILFNPFLPISLNQALWAIFDLGAAFALIFHYRLQKKAHAKSS